MLNNEYNKKKYKINNFNELVLKYNFTRENNIMQEIKMPGKSEDTLSLSPVPTLMNSQTN